MMLVVLSLLHVIGLVKVNGNEARKYLQGLLPGNILAQHCKYGVGSGYCAKDFGSTAHVDVVGKTAGISVSSLYYSAVSRKVQRYEAHLLPGSRCLSLLQHRVVQIVAVGDHVHVIPHVGGDFCGLQYFQVARQGGLRDDMPAGGKQSCQLVLAPYAVFFNQLDNELKSCPFVLHNALYSVL